MMYKFLKFVRLNLVILLSMNQICAGETSSIGGTSSEVKSLSATPYALNKAVLVPILNNCNQPDLKADLENDVITYEHCLTTLKERMPTQDISSYSSDWFSNNIAQWTTIFNFYGFLHKEKIVKALEIGSWQGRSSCWMLQNIAANAASEIHCIDTFEGSIENTNDLENALLFNCFSHNVYITNNQEKCFPYKGKSQDVLKSIFSAYQNYFDFIYIDGSHIAEDVLNDAILAFPLLKKGGLLFFDDYGWRGYPVPNFAPELCPKLGIDKFMHLYKDQIKVIKIAYQVYIEKV